MEYVAIVTTLALMQAFYFAVNVGQQRAKHKIDAPATIGNPALERAFRVHQNTLEQLVIVIPSMWIFATYWRPEIAAALGVVFIVARQIYRNAYIGDPANRGAGFGLGALVTAILLLGSLVGAVMNLL
jgi:glutathione S-transferase